MDNGRRRSIERKTGQISSKCLGFPYRELEQKTRKLSKTTGHRLHKNNLRKTLQELSDSVKPVFSSKTTGQLPVFLLIRGCFVPLRVFKDFSGALSRIRDSRIANEGPAFSVFRQSPLVKTVRTSHPGKAALGLYSIQEY